MLTIPEILEGIGRLHVAQRRTLLEQCKRRWCVQCGLEVQENAPCRCSRQDAYGSADHVDHDGWTE
jgi:hypothetical protein